MNEQEFIEKIKGMKAEESYSYKGKNGILYEFQRYSEVTCVLWIFDVDRYLISVIYFDDMSITDEIIRLKLDKRCVGCIPRFQIEVE